MVHEPLAHGRARERRQILIRRCVGCRRGNDRRVRHRARFFQDRKRARDIRVLLADGDVDAIERSMVLQPAFFASFVQTRLANDRVDRDRRFSRGAIADDQLTLTAADRNHRVDRHDPGLDRLADAFSFDHTRRNFFERISRFRFDRAFAVERLAEGVDDAAEQRFTDRDLEKFAGRLRFVPFHHQRRVAEQDGADFRLFEVEREPEDAARKLDHLVQHDVAQPFDARDAVTGFADDADIAFTRRRFQSGDLRFNFFEDAAHNVVGLKLLLETMQAIAHAAVPHIAADANAHSAQQIFVHDKSGGEIAAVFAFQVREQVRLRLRRQFRRALDRGRALFQFEPEQSLVALQRLDVIARLRFNERFHKGRDPAVVELAVDKARAEQLLRKLSRLFVDLHRFFVI